MVESGVAMFNRVFFVRELVYLGRDAKSVEVLGAGGRIVVYANGEAKKVSYPVAILHTGYERNYLIFQDSRDAGEATLLGTVEIPNDAFIVVRFKNGVKLEVKS